ncbi:hypothetical protein [Nostoc phage N1]|nr:hypothetical protein [Nostoc phage N1]
MNGDPASTMMEFDQKITSNNYHIILRQIRNIIKADFNLSTNPNIVLVNFQLLDDE